MKLQSGSKKSQIFSWHVKRRKICAFLLSCHIPLFFKNGRHLQRHTLLVLHGLRRHTLPVLHGLHRQTPLVLHGLGRQTLQLQQQDQSSRQGFIHTGDQMPPKELNIQLFISF